MYRCNGRFISRLRSDQASINKAHHSSSFMTNKGYENIHIPSLLRITQSAELEMSKCEAGEIKDSILSESRFLD